MKQLLSTLVCCLVAAQCNTAFAAEKLKEVDMCMLRGKVKSVVSTMTDLATPNPDQSNNEAEGAETCYGDKTLSYGFDTQGNLTYIHITDLVKRTITIVDEGQRKATEVWDDQTRDFTYTQVLPDEASLNFEGKWKSNDGGGGDISSQEFTFDEQHRLILAESSEPFDLINCSDCNDRRTEYIYRGNEFLPYAINDGIGMGGDGYTYELSVKYTKVDKYGNWLVRICTDKETKKAVFKEERSITYYE